MRPALHSNPKSGLSPNLKIGVLYGGNSSERPISLKSGRAVLAALKQAGFSACWIDPKDTSKLAARLQTIDLAFIALHGKGGEDGRIQQYLEKKKIPYIGSDAAASRRAFDKGLSKKIFLKSGIPTPFFTIIDRSNWKKRLSRFPVPFFVKPPCEGSSIGAFPVEDFRREAEKLRRHLNRFGRLLVEEKIEGREFTVGILGQKALPVIELRPKNKFYDYKAKYTKGMTMYDVPARIPRTVAKKMQRLALKVHRVLGLRDFSRVDMMTDASGGIYILEANSIPGFTEFSLLPKAAKEAGISFQQLCTQLVVLAYRRFQ